LSTIRDIAKLAGVSVSTASLALNGDQRVKPATREKVEEAAAALRYHPTRAAQSLSMGRTWSIHLLYPGQGAMSSGFFSRFLRGLHDGARDRGYSVALSVPVDADEARETLTRLMHERWADGVVLMNLADDDVLLRDALAFGFPHVLLGRSSLPDVASVDNDNHAVAREATDHLLERGCRHLVLLNGPAEQRFTHERAAGFQDAHAGRTVPLPGDAVLFTDGQPQTARKLLADRLVGGARFDGVVAVSDSLAVAALQAVRDHGLDVPGDVRLIGMNNDDISQYVTPRLSTVELHGYELGRAGVDLLLGHVDGRARVPERRMVAHELVVRESSG
jgi:LacI family transcriptional regulator